MRPRKWLGVRPSDLDVSAILLSSHFKLTLSFGRSTTFRSSVVRGPSLDSVLVENSEYGSSLLLFSSSGLPMTEHDIKTGKELLEEDFIKKNPAWHAELQAMVDMKEKAEIRYDTIALPHDSTLHLFASCL